MKKILTILPIVGLVLGLLAIATEIKANDLRPIVQKEQVLSGKTAQCIKHAMIKRETSIISSTTIYQNATLAALSTRQSRLLAAWDKPTKTEVKPLVSVTWKTYKASMKTAKESLSTAKKTTWSTYKTDIQACQASPLLKTIDTSSLSSEE